MKFLCNSKEDEQDEPKPKSKSQTNSSSSVHSAGGSSKERHYCELDAKGEMVCRKLTSYECKLEDDVEQLQDALFRITSHYAKIQFRLRQIATASGCERMCLLKELERMTSQDLDNCKNREIDSEMPSLASDSQSLGNVRVKQHKILTQLRGRLQNLAEAAGTCFHTEAGGCYNLSRCVCQKIKKGVETSQLPPIFDNDGNLIENLDQGCHCCNCKARLDQQGKVIIPGAGNLIENGNGVSSAKRCGRRCLAETWSDTDYGKADMVKAILKANKKSKKSKRSRKKSSSRSRKQQYYVDFEDYGSAGDQKSPRTVSSRKSPKYSADDYGSAGDPYSRSRAKTVSKQRNRANDKGRAATSSRTPSRARDRTPNRGSGQIQTANEFYHRDEATPLKASTSLRFPARSSFMRNLHSPLTPDYTKSETNQMHRSSRAQNKLFIHNRSDSQGQGRVENRLRCKTICRTNRMCQRMNCNKDNEHDPAPYESDIELSNRSSSSKSQLRNRQYNGKNDKSQRHLFNQIMGDNPKLQLQRSPTNQSVKNYNEENRTHENQNQDQTPQSHEIACTCCPCSRRMVQDFGIKKQTERSSSSKINNNSNQNVQNKPVIVVKSDIWMDTKDSKSKEK